MAAVKDLVAASAAEVEFVEDLAPELAPTVIQELVDKKNLDVTAAQGRIRSGIFLCDWWCPLSS